MHDIISEVLVPTHEDDAFDIVQPTMLPENDTKIKINMATLNEPPSERLLYKLPGPTYCKNFRADDRLTTLQTAIERYSKPTKPQPNAHLLGEKMYNSMLYKMFNHQPKLTREDLIEAARATCEKMQERGTHNQVTELLMNEKNMQSVDFFMKQIIKFKVASVDANTSTKAGQGISAGSKDLNSFFCVIVRALEVALRRALKNEVSWTNGEAEESYGIKFAEQAHPEFGFLEGDGVEFDCSQGPVCHYIEKRMMVDAGVSSELVDYLFAHKELRRLVSRDFFAIEVHEKKDSGKADTIFGNTLWTTACVAYVIEWSVIYLVFLKGDDNLINGESVTVSPTRIKELEDIGCVWKFNYTDVASFCNFFYTPIGALPDHFQRAAKLLSKKFRDSAEIEAYHTSLKDQLRLVKTWNHHHATILCASAYYGISSASSEFLLNCLMTLISEGSFKFFSRFERKTFFVGRRE